MAAVKMKVDYLDGRSEVVLASPKAQVMTERHFAGIKETQQVEGSFYLAWASLHYAGLEPADFEVWLEKIHGAEVIGEEVVDPTPATPQLGTSSS